MILRGIISVDMEWGLRDDEGQRARGDEVGTGKWWVGGWQFGLLVEGIATTGIEGTDDE